MLILLDGRPLQTGDEGEKIALIRFCLRELSIRYPAWEGRKGIEWVLALDGRWRDPRLDGLPGQLVAVRSRLPGTTGWKLWYGWQLPRLAAKYKVDWVMTTGGVAAATSVPQINWMPGLSTEGDGSKKSVLSTLYRQRMISSLQHSRVILSFPGETPAGAGDRARVVTPAADVSIRPLGPEEREAAKARYAGGREYFFTDISGVGEDDVVELLRAFSRFKKRQLSNMQWVLAAGGAGLPGLSGKLATYKYREDVHVLQEEKGVAAGAYALVDPFGRGKLGLRLLESWRTGVPVITTGTVTEMTGDAVLYAAAGDPAALAEQLMIIYKDELLRGRVIEKGREREKLYPVERSVEAIREALGG